jgi:hypothetical protein
VGELGHLTMYVGFFFFFWGGGGGGRGCVVAQILGIRSYSASSDHIYLNSVVWFSLIFSYRMLGNLRRSSKCFNLFSGCPS